MANDLQDDLLTSAPVTPLAAALAGQARTTAEREAAVAAPEKTRSTAHAAPRCPPPLSEALLAAYRASDFQVSAAPRLHLRIGARSPAAAALLAEYQADRAILLTAWNPFSEPREFAENEQRQRALHACLLDVGLTMLPALGVDPSGEWPAEESVFAFGASAACTDRLLERFEQNAAVVVEADGSVHLQLHPRLRLTDASSLLDRRSIETLNRYA
ncbi:DUF3293 domain-containing protein [Chitinasiproducens palmae]|uniref:DUF3293 domain-containing protein n=1 Tax=Chitinasiproducens palmae TaxID=1770053 RepID=A0A1H2PQ14_9BURK|nr:DUF3293 domain-containing protein [Chitinasiproducens palmae]SDV48430.1 Protein of unknown function [Chitinasiproducens palmae]